MIVASARRFAGAASRIVSLSSAVCANVATDAAATALRTNRAMRFIPSLQKDLLQTVQGAPSTITRHEEARENSLPMIFRTSTSVSGRKPKRKWVRRDGQFP